jgi:hypothetical protein
MPSNLKQTLRGFWHFLLYLKYKFINQYLDYYYLKKQLSKSTVVEPKEADRFHNALLKIFIASGGKQHDRLSSYVQQKYPLANDHNATHLPNADLALTKQVSELEKNGYLLIPSYFNKEFCDEVVKYALNEKSFPRKRDLADTTLEQMKFQPPFLSARYDFSPERASILKNENLQNIISDRYILQIVSKYLGSSPYLDPIELFWTVPFPIRDPGWAEDYHFDMDSLRWLKVFVNFEDIKVINGPHCFVEGSHLSGGIPRSLLKKGYQRLTDLEVFEIIEQNCERIFVVPAGSVLIEDTRGLHKGLTPTEGRRLMFSVQYSNVAIKRDYQGKSIKFDFQLTDSFKVMLKNFKNIGIKHWYND